MGSTAPSPRQVGRADILRTIGRVFGKIQRLDAHEVNASAVRAHHGEAEPAELDRLAFLGQVPQSVHDQAADGVELLVREVAAEVGVEIFDGRAGLGTELVLAAPKDARAFVVVVLVVDLADDLLEHVLDGHEPGGTAVLVDDDRHVIAARTKFLQQDIESLALGHEDSGTQQITDVEGASAVVSTEGEQVFGEQDADHLALVVAGHGETRMCRFDRDLEDLLERVVAPEIHHLGTRNHDVAHAQIGDLQHAFDHAQGIRIEQLALLRIFEHLQELLLVLRLAPEHLADSLEPVT